MDARRTPGPAGAGRRHLRLGGARGRRHDDRPDAADARPSRAARAGLQLNARLYDLYPDGTQVLVDRGVHTLADDSGHRRARPARQRMAIPAGPPHPRRDRPGRRPLRPAVRPAGDRRRQRGQISPCRSARIAPGDPGDAGPDVTLRVVARARRPVRPDGALADRRADARSPSTSSSSATGSATTSRCPGRGRVPPRTLHRDARGSPTTSRARAIDRRGVRARSPMKSAVAR